VFEAPDPDAPKPWSISVESFGALARFRALAPTPDRRATIVALDEDPGGSSPDGNPADGAVPNFVLQISLETGAENYRTLEVTFDPPE
jgi:hypothetical protein